MQISQPQPDSRRDAMGTVFILTFYHQITFSYLRLSVRLSFPLVYRLSCIQLTGIMTLRQTQYFTICITLQRFINCLKNWKFMPCNSSLIVLPIHNSKHRLDKLDSLIPKRTSNPPKSFHSNSFIILVLDASSEKDEPSRKIESSEEGRIIRIKPTIGKRCIV